MHRFQLCHSGIDSMEIEESLHYGELCPYAPPSWIAKLNNVPSVFVRLAMTPTPIHKWDLPKVPQKFQVYIKRDDLTGSALTGNKVRKLEFVFGHILQNGYKHIVTFGGLQSNHCRATAIIAAQLGIKCHLILESGSNQIHSSNGNLLLTRMCDPSIYLFPNMKSFDQDVLPRLTALTQEIFQKTGEKAYDLYPGASDHIGLFGYLDAWQELMEQGVQEKFDDIVVVYGSAGTVSGLAIGNYLTGQKVKIHCVTIEFDSQFLYDHINEMTDAVGLEDVQAEDMVNIIEGYIGEGYGKSTDEDHNLYKTIAATTGIVCDPTYVGKGVKGLISELITNPSRFRGDRVLFIHTGGIFGLYDGRMFNTFDNDRVYDWSDIKKSPKQCS